MTQFPSMPVQKAVDRLVKAYTVIGAQPAYDRAAIAHALGYSNPQSGRFSVLMTSLQLYGLVERTSNRYTFSPIFTAIFTAPHDASGKQALADAALTPAPFRNLYTAFKDNRLPPDLVRWFMHQYLGELQESDAQQAAAIFTENMTAAGLLKEGMLLGRRPQTPAPGSQPGAAPPAAAEPAMTVLEKDFGNGRIAHVSIPADLTQDERDNLMALIQYL